MTIARVKSRVRFPGRAKRDRKNRKHFPEKSKPKKTSNDTHGPTKAPKGRNLCFGRYYHQTNPLTGSVYMFPVEIDNRIYDDSNSVDDDTASFLKKRVLTTDDQESDGAFKSGLRTTLILCRIPLVTENPDVAGGDADEYDHEPSGASNDGHSAEPKESCVPSVSVILDAPESVTDENDEPPSSVLMQAPLWAWPAEWFPADSIPAAPATTTDSSSDVKCGTLDSSLVTTDTMVDPSRAKDETIIDTSPLTEDSTADSSPVVQESVKVSSSATADNTAVSSSVVSETISDLSSASADTISDLSSESVGVAPDSSPAATVTVTGLHPGAAVTTVNSTLATAAPTPNSGPVVVKSTAAPSLGPWHQWFVRLFAGRKSNQPDSPPQSTPEQPISIISWTRERSSSEADVVLPPLPRLELSRVLPETRRKKSRVIDRPGYAIKILQAPYHDFIGRAVLEEDADDARAVQCGFKVASNSHIVPLAQRRNNSDSSLLDRDGDAWADWNKLNITADAMPFAKFQSDTNLLHPRTGARMARNTSMYSAEWTKGQTGHCFLEDAGHRYPFGGLGL